MAEHSWPAELDSDTRCENCGLKYIWWSEDDSGCSADQHAFLKVQYREMRAWEAVRKAARAEELRRADAD